MELLFRDLKAEEMECRVGNTKRKNPKEPKGKDNPVIGFQILLYKNARVDANILDETVGAFNWTKKFYQVKNTMFCEVAIRDKDTGEWVAKSDCGDDDFQTEQVKGEASDAFKRACFAWSLGRMNLYYAPFIWINCGNGIDEFSKLYVSEVDYRNHIISKLVIRERVSDRVVFSFGSNAKVPQNEQKPQKQRISEEQHEKDMAIINTYLDTPNKTQESKDRFISWVERTTGFSDLSKLYTDYLNTNRVANAIREKE